MAPKVMYWPPYLCPAQAEAERMELERLHNERLSKLRQREEETLDLLTKGARYKEIADELGIGITIVVILVIEFFTSLALELFYN